MNMTQTKNKMVQFLFRAVNKKPNYTLYTNGYEQDQIFSIVHDFHHYFMKKYNEESWFRNRHYVIDIVENQYNNKLVVRLVAVYIQEKKCWVTDELQLWNYADATDIHVHLTAKGEDSFPDDEDELDFKDDREKCSICNQVIQPMYEEHPHLGTFCGCSRFSD